MYSLPWRARGLVVSCANKPVNAHPAGPAPPSRPVVRRPTRPVRGVSGFRIRQVWTILHTPCCQTWKQRCSHAFHDKSSGNKKLRPPAQQPEQRPHSVSPHKDRSGCFGMYAGQLFQRRCHPSGTFAAIVAPPCFPAVGRLKTCFFCGTSGFWI